jgi:glycine/D-amino acid oxidase-like deaminating enzyme
LPDAIVVGAGICGASAAHFLSERGLDVLVLDRLGIAGGTSSRGEGNVLLCDKPPGPERDLTVPGRALWVELGERFPYGRVTAKGSLMIEPPLDADLDDPSAPAAVPGGDPFEPALARGVGWEFDPGDLQVDAPGMCRALLHPIPVRSGVRVTNATAHMVTLNTGEKLSAAHVIVATGPWAGELTGLPVEPRKGQLVALAAPPGMIVHKLIEAAYLDAVADEDAGLALATVIEQTLDGDELLIGSSRLRVGFDTTVDPLITAAMIERAARFVPEVASLEITRAWCGFRPWLPDHLPAIGKLRNGAWTSTGHEGSGVGLGPVSGQLLAQLICGETPLIDPAPFDPARFR